jgi:hypothetical protein
MKNDHTDRKRSSRSMLASEATKKQTQRNSWQSAVAGVAISFIEQAPCEQFLPAWPT